MFAIPQAIKRRKRLLLTLTGLAAILLAIGGVLYWHSRESLLEFVNQDVRELDDSQQTGLRKLLAEYLPDAFPGPRTRLNRVLERTLPEEFRPSHEHDNSWSWKTWYVWRLETETNSHFVVFQVGIENGLWGTSELAARLISEAATIHFLDATGKYEGHSKTYVGWWNEVTDATLLHHELLDAAVIQITVSPWFARVPGKRLRRQIYALFENRVALLRIEDLNGNLVADRGNIALGRLGPPPVMRTVEEWEELLLSSEHRHILEALTWIGSEHWSGPEDGVRDEVVKEGRLADAVRKRPAVQRRIEELTQSENRWLREAAVLAQESLPK